MVNFLFILISIGCSVDFDSGTCDAGQLDCNKNCAAKFSTAEELATCIFNCEINSYIEDHKGESFSLLGQSENSLAIEPAALSSVNDFSNITFADVEKAPELTEEDVSFLATWGQTLAVGGAVTICGIVICGLTPSCAAIAAVVAIKVRYILSRNQYGANQSIIHNNLVNVDIFQQISKTVMRKLNIRNLAQTSDLTKIAAYNNAIKEALLNYFLKPTT